MYNDPKRNQDESDVGQLIHSIRSALDTLERKLTGGGKSTKGPRAKLASVPPAEVPVVPITIQDKIRLGLVNESLNVKQIAKNIGEPATTVEAAMRDLFKAGLLISVMGKGWGEKSLWRWAVNSKDPSNTARRELEKQLLMERPMTHSELRDAIKATDKQVQNDLIELRRREMMWKMNADGHDHLYHLPADRAEPPPQFDARIPAKTYKKPAGK